MRWQALPSVRGALGHRRRVARNFAWALSLAASLTACGGGSSESSSTAASESTPLTESVDVSEAAVTPDVYITLTPASTRPISPYIYGLNGYASITNAPPLPTFNRAGGNRWTAYNWENNASNSGLDNGFTNDNHLSKSNVPGEAVRTVIASDMAVGAASLITVQMQGWVAADETGVVSTVNSPESGRFKPLVFKKSTQTSEAFTATPSTADNAVYMDEFVWALDQQFSGQGIFSNSAIAATFIQLDNEPELWRTTHLEVQGDTPVASDAYIAKTIALAKALKDQFPAMTIFGPAHFGFRGLYSWQGELAPSPGANNWFADKYLAALNSAGNAYGMPLVDAYDFHWYSEATAPDATEASGIKRVTKITAAALTDAQVQAIAQSPRSLWDSSYSESSWIRDVMRAPIALLPRLQAKISAANPGMKLSISEYQNGGCQHIAGTLAQADNLGIFGAQGVYAANYWPLIRDEPYCMAAFRAFRGFDGANATYGDVAVQASSSDVQSVAAYASTDSKHSGRTVFVAINRSPTAKQTRFSGLALSGTAHLYRISAASAAGQNPVKPVSLGTRKASGAVLNLSLPALSVTTIDVY